MPPGPLSRKTEKDFLRCRSAGNPAGNRGERRQPRVDRERLHARVRGVDDPGRQRRLNRFVANVAEVIEIVRPAINAVCDEEIFFPIVIEIRK